MDQTTLLGRKSKEKVVLMRTLSLASLAVASLISLPVTALAQEISTFALDGRNVTLETAPNSRTIRIEDAAGEAASRVWVENLDSEGRTISIDGPQTGSDDVTRIDWSPDNRSKTITNPVGHVSRFDYDEAGQLILLTSPNGTQTRFDYDVAGQITSFSKWVNTNSPAITELTWSSGGDLTQIILPNGTFVTKIRDSNGQYTSNVQRLFEDISSWHTQDSLQNYLPNFNKSEALELPKELLGENALNITRDDQGRITGGVDASGQSLFFSYDDNGYLDSFVDGRGIETRFAHNGFGDVTKEVTGERGTTRNIYDEAGRLTRQTREGGLIVKRDYDAVGRVTRVVYKERGIDRKVHRYSYDDCINGVGRICRVNTDGIITRYAYTQRGALAQSRVRYEDGRVETTGYDYTTRGQLSTLAYPTGLKVRYHYDEDGFVRRVTGQYDTGEDKEQFVIAKNIKIDPNTAQLEQLTFGNGLKTKWRYGTNGAVRARTVVQDGAPTDRARYGYDDRGNITVINRLDSAQSQQFGYDAMDRLVSEHRPQNTDDPQTRNYQYDAANNRTALDTGMSSLSYTYANDANQLQSVGRKAFEYDDRGNLLWDRQGKRGFEYDVTNRMTAFYKRGKLKASYRYNASGQRISKTLHHASSEGDDYQTLLFSYTPDGWLLSENGQRADKKASFARDYVWLGNKPLAQIERRIRPDGTTKKARVTYLHTDHLNTPEWGSDDSGSTVWRWNRDAFGAVKPERDPDTDGVKTVIRLRFPGQYADQDSGLFYNHNRDYDPNLGRYIQSDPIGLNGGVNRYAYVEGNPIGNYDANGLKTCTGSRIKRSAGYNCGTLNNYSGGLGTTATDFTCSGPLNNDSCVATFAPSGGTTFGHFYTTSNVVCRDAGVLSPSDRLSILRRYTVPRPAGLEVELPEGISRNLVLHPSLFNPGGWVDSSFDRLQMCGQNVTTPNHIFEGTVQRCLVERNGELVITTVGFGPDAGSFFNWLNDVVGPGTFDSMDANAFAFIGARRPGC